MFQTLVVISVVFLGLAGLCLVAVLCAPSLDDMDVERL